MRIFSVIAEFIQNVKSVIYIEEFLQEYLVSGQLSKSLGKDEEGDTDRRQRS